MSRKKHRPIRTCVGCGKRAERSELVRLIRSENGSVLRDESGAAAGRGSYLHRCEVCWTSFARRRGMVRSFRAPLTSQARTALVEELRAGESL